MDIYCCRTNSLCSTQTNLRRNNASNIEMTWQLPASPNPCFVGYEIYAAIGAEVALMYYRQPLTMQSKTTTFLLSIASGGQPVFLYMINQGSCTNPSPPAATTSDTLDNIKPQPYIVLKNATIINGKVQLNWFPAPALVVAYLVYNDRDGFTKPDTVFRQNKYDIYRYYKRSSQFAITYKVRALEYCEDPVGLFKGLSPLILLTTERYYCKFQHPTNAPKPLMLLGNPIRLAVHKLFLMM